VAGRPILNYSIILKFRKKVTSTIFFYWIDVSKWFKWKLTELWNILEFLRHFEFLFLKNLNISFSWSRLQRSRIELFIGLYDNKGLQSLKGGYVCVFHPLCFFHRCICLLRSSSCAACIFSINCVFPLAVLFCHGRHILSSLYVFDYLCFFFAVFVHCGHNSNLVDESGFSEKLHHVHCVRCVLKLRHCQSRCQTVRSCSHSLQ
jgi:hypothetical protein